MTRLIHDQFSKQYLQDLLSPFGEVETGKEISPEVRQVDVFFVPSPNPTDELSRQRNALGLLGRFATQAALFEPFRNPATRSNIRSCLGKLFDVQSERERQANRDRTPLSEATLPKLWVLTPTASDELLQSFHAFPDETRWGKGIYFLGEALHGAIVVIHQLPATPETLWLRLLGRKKVQERAMAELKALPEADPFRRNALELVNRLFKFLKARQQTADDVDLEDRELIMTLQEMLDEELERLREKDLAEGRRQGRQEGRQEGLEEGLEEGHRQGLEEAREETKQKEKLAIANVLKIRFGEIDEELEATIAAIAQLSIEESVPLLLQLSREEILARFGNDGEDSDRNADLQ